jgi:hypothetical protein
VSDAMSTNMGTAFTAALATATVGIPAVLKIQTRHNQSDQLRSGAGGT